MFTEEISLVKPSYIDSPYSSEPIEDWDNPVLVPVHGRVSIQPDTSAVTGETYDGMGQTRLLTGYRLITEPGLVLDTLTANDRIRVTGWSRDLSVVGAPSHFKAIIKHTEANLVIHDSSTGGY